MTATETPGRICCVLIAGGKYHDIDFARLELLKLLARDERVRVRVFEDYENTSAIAEADFLVSYTCDVVPSLTAPHPPMGCQTPNSYSRKERKVNRLGQRNGDMPRYFV